MVLTSNLLPFALTSFMNSLHSISLKRPLSFASTKKSIVVTYSIAFSLQYCVISLKLELAYTSLLNLQYAIQALSPLP